MPYCRSCGEQIPQGSKFCPKCGARVKLGSELVLASWGERFIAWLIDMILLGAVLGFYRLPGLYWLPRIWGAAVPHWIPFVNLGFNNLIYFLYWVFLEGNYSQSVGKMVMRIKVTDLDGGTINMTSAVIQSIGKAFLLPLDCILGWFLYPSRQQRLFNHLAETVVLKKLG
ncbi:MAG: RDD family protein [Candidatus Bathyarchaeia archaeon]